MTRLEEQERIGSEEIQIDISDEDLLTLAKLAHEQDITLNQLVNNILREKMQEFDTNFQIYKRELREEFHNEVDYDLQSGVYENDVYVEYLEKKLYDADVPVIHSIS